jgi:hypothetical protein
MSETFKNKNLDELEILIESEFNKKDEEISMLKFINNEHQTNLKNMDKTLFEYINKNNILRQEINMLKTENKIIKIICYSCVVFTGVTYLFNTIFL